MNHLIGCQYTLKSLAICVGLLVFSSCSDKGCTDPLAQNYDVDASKDDGSCTYGDFDRLAFNSNYVDNLIEPAIVDFNQKVAALSSSVQALKNDLTPSNLNASKTAYTQAYLSWQNVSAYQFGLAESLSWRLSTNAYPVDTSKIEGFITNQAYNLAAASSIDAQGLGAIDYLLYAESETQTLQGFAQDSLRVQYLADVVDLIEDNISAYATDFQGSFKTTFKENIATDAGSTLGLLVNNINQDFEILKNAQIGIPLGKKTLGQVQPTFTQGYYSKLSYDLCLEHLNRVELNFTGGSGSALGLDDYLDFLGAKHDDENLSDKIKAQINLCQTKLQAINSPISQAVVNNSTLVDEFYTEAVALVVLLKTDMPSALSVLITYQDNDGD